MNNKTLSITIVLIIMFAQTTIVKSQISPLLFGQNAWMPDSIGETKYWGKLDSTWQYIEDCNIKLIRIGGIANDNNLITNNQISKLIDSIRNIGAEPLIQVPYKNGLFSASQAANLVNYTNIINNYNIKYWSISNEPVLAYSFTAEQIATYFKEFATAMKQVDNTIKIVGPDLAWYNESVLNKLIGGENDITGIDDFNNYYLDIVSFHIYTFNGTQTISEVKEKYETYLKPTVISIVNKLHNANNINNRIGTDSLRWAITEFNINYKNPDENGIDGLGANSFINGQLWSEIFSLGMRYKAIFMCPWSIHESNGNAGTYDLGFINNYISESNPRSSYYHEQLLSQNTYDFYADYYNNVIGVKTFGSYNNDSICVTILNMNNQAYDYEVFHNPTESSTSQLQINTNTLNIQNSFSDNISQNCTHTLVFNKQGQIIKKYKYSSDDVKPVLTEFTPSNIKQNQNSFNVYPNPFKEKININLNKNDFITIFNSCGVPVLKTRLKSNINSINLSYLKKGIYFLSLYDGVDIKQIKIIKI